MQKGKATLCWFCANACGGCSWSDGSFEPVDGWKAKKTKLKTDHGAVADSFLVIKCPEFKPDTEPPSPPKHGKMTLRRTKKNSRFYMMFNLGEAEIMRRLGYVRGRNRIIMEYAFFGAKTNIEIAEIFGISAAAVERAVWETLRIMEAAR